ncbi:MAG: pyruvate dehydrogenase (acetyl-transferring) E1 component subunit alpha, partial [Anaerolineae bacterium]|nr:pyruvate dehydrogenase (acetyl-transferring) E1 component subunit alpha [Anaerolineae bacterium]
PLAAGLALADQYRGEDRVTICMMGDGATNIGYFHESLNLSAVWKLPVIWMIENNEYGMGTAVERASAVTDLTKKALAYDMATMKVDGMDAVAAIKGLEKAAKHCRDGNGPILVEARTYRYRGHSMGDPERYRTAEEIEERRKSDPVTRWEDTLIEEKAATKDAIARMDAAVEEEVNEAIEFSRNSPTLAKEELAHYVYA